MITLQNTFENSISLFESIKRDRSIIPVFDLDGVIIDATHRQLTKADGSLDLDHYRENSKPSMIEQDRALPFAITLLKLTEAQIPFYVCTARVICKSSKKWLTKRGIKPSMIMSREGENDFRRDHVLKRDHLTKLFTEKELQRSFLIDDNENNLKMASDLKMAAIHVPFMGH
jgi:hypothetical protein